MREISPDEDGRYEMENEEKIDSLYESEVQVFALNLDGTEIPRMERSSGLTLNLIGQYIIEMMKGLYLLIETLRLRFVPLS